MKQEWLDYLINNGAEMQDNVIQHFGNPDRELRLAPSGDIITDLSHTGLIAVRGDDATTFLQGQLTNDISKVDNEHAQISGYCSPKGRLLSNFLIFRRADSYYFRLPKALIEDTIKRLSMFVLMSKVTIEDASDAQIHIGYCGPHAADELAGIIGNIPQNPLETIQDGDLTIIRLPGKNPRFEILGPIDRIRKLWEALNVRGVPVGPEVWSWLTIHNGLPIIVPETVDAFVPQMVNMQLIDGVSFKKGCYTGQEIVARMQYLGTLKRRMYLAHLKADEMPAAGENLYAADSNNKSVGKIVNICPAPDGGFDLLAVIEIKRAESDTIHTGDSSGPALQLLDLPYAFEADKE